MILIVHIIIALTSLALASIALIRPTRNRLNLNYVFIALTLASGTILVVSGPAHLLQSCISGLTYTVLVSVALFAAQKRLQAAKQISDETTKS